MHHIFKQQFSVVASASEQGWLNISFNAYNQMLDGKFVRINFGLIQGYEFDTPFIFIKVLQNREVRLPSLLVALALQ